jgi:hypothetical protein
MANYVQEGKKMEIGITSWDKHNPKRDQKTYTWLKLSNNIGTAPDMFNYDAEQKYIWILLLCEASQKSNKEIEITPEYLSHVSGIMLEKVKLTLGKLLEDEFIYKPNKIIGVADESEYDRARSQDDSSTTPRIDKNREDKNRIDKNREEGASAFEILNFWNSKNIITHKETEKLLHQIQKAQKKNNRSFSETLMAITNYAAVLEDPGTYFKHRWTLIEFLTREGADKFYHEQFDRSWYLAFSNKKSSSTEMAKAQIANNPYRDGVA